MTLSPGCSLVAGGKRSAGGSLSKEPPQLMLTIAANEAWGLRSIDISAAFLQGRQIDRMKHIQPPNEFRKPRIVWRLKKGLYGLKEAARQWYNELLEALQRNGGRRLTGDSACILFHN